MKTINRSLLVLIVAFLTCTTGYAQKRSSLTANTLYSYANAAVSQRHISGADTGIQSLGDQIQFLIGVTSRSKDISTVSEKTWETVKTKIEKNLSAKIIRAIARNFGVSQADAKQMLRQQIVVFGWTDMHGNIYWLHADI